jgi:hypothetical protein
VALMWNSLGGCKCAGHRPPQAEWWGRGLCKVAPFGSHFSQGVACISRLVRLCPLPPSPSHHTHTSYWQPDPKAAVPEDIPVDGIAYGLLPQDHPCEQLRGQGSVVATRDLAPGEVVATYRSYAALENQYRRFRLKCVATSGVGLRCLLTLGRALDGGCFVWVSMHAATCTYMPTPPTPTLSCHPPLATCSPPSTWPTGGHWRAVYEMLVECYAVEDGVHVLVPPCHTSDDGSGGGGAAAAAGGAGGGGDGKWKLETLSYSAWGYGNTTACANDPIIGVVDVSGPYTTAGQFILGVVLFGRPPPPPPAPASSTSIPIHLYLPARLLRSCSAACLSRPVHAPPSFPPPPPPCMHHVCEPAAMQLPMPVLLQHNCLPQAERHAGPHICPAYLVLLQHSCDMSCCDQS